MLPLKDADYHEWVVEIVDHGWGNPAGQGISWDYKDLTRELFPNEEIENAREKLYAYTKGTNLPNDPRIAAKLFDIAFSTQPDVDSIRDVYFTSYKKTKYSRRLLADYTVSEFSANRRALITEALTATLRESGWTCEIFGQGQGVTDLSLNRRITLGLVTAKICDVGGILDAAIEYPNLKEFAVALAKREKREHKKALFNTEGKIRMCGDLNESGSVRIQRTDYFSALATDRLAWKTVHTTALDGEGKPLNQLWDGISAFINEQQSRLRSLGESRISNQIGASTLALTRDGYLLITYQKPDNAYSERLFAPSGSGSLAWKDDYEIDPETTFLNVIGRGALRELKEECLFGAHKHRGAMFDELVAYITPIGFARMLHRAGKPEFYFIGYVDGYAENIMARKPERYIGSVVTGKTVRRKLRCGAYRCSNIEKLRTVYERGVATRDTRFLSS